MTTPTFPANLRKIVYKHGPQGMWVASLKGEKTTKDGRITQEPDTKITGRTYEELMRLLAEYK